MSTTTNGWLWRAGVAVVFCATFALLCSLGLWQLSRAEQKRARFATYSDRIAAPVIDLDDLAADADADAYHWRRVRLRGRYRDFHVLLDNRVHNGRAGYEVLTPFRTDGGRTVLIARGWVPWPAAREDVPQVTAPADPLALRGYLGDPPAAGVDLAGDDGAAEWLSERVVRVQRVAFDALAGPLQVAPWPALVYLEADQPAAFAVARPTPGDGSARHMSYAVQWFAMAVVLAGIGAWQWRRARSG